MYDCQQLKSRLSRKKIQVVKSCRLGQSVCFTWHAVCTVQTRSSAQKHGLLHAVMGQAAANEVLCVMGPKMLHGSHTRIIGHTHMPHGGQTGFLGYTHRPPMSHTHASWVTHRALSPESPCWHAVGSLQSQPHRCVRSLLWALVPFHTTHFCANAPAGTATHT